MNRSHNRRTRQMVMVATLSAITLSLVFLGACASTPSRNEAYLQAWSVRCFPPEMVVAVSPVRQTMQIAGSFATVIGAAITAAQDAESRKRLESVLGTLDQSVTFQETIAKKMMAGANGVNRVKVEPPDDIRNPQERREADRKRLRDLRRNGIAEVVDISLKYGLFGPEGELVTIVQAVQTDTRTGKTTFKGKWLITAEPPNAFGPLGDPTRRMTPNITSPRLAKATYAVDRWLVAGGQPLQQGLMRLAEHAALVLDATINEREQPGGWYALGVNALRHKKYRDARTLLERAVQADPDNPDYALAMAVTLDRLGQQDLAVSITRQALEHHPDQPRLMVNLAWWLAKDRQHAAEAETLFRRAVELGAPEYPAVSKAIEKARKKN
ncbi:MAG: tetratricopeptide repeat protein [Candidatus Hydrogenedentes bacterium]|nr:tetratricopeptide repeat protein [Candidatus Hydrogenedentota bacterium]